MIIIDITKDYLEMFTAKKDIEDLLISSGEIKTRFEISEFINYLDFGKHIYWESSDNIYPFSIIDTPNERYVFIVIEDGKKTDALFSALEDIDYDFSNLIKKDAMEISAEEIVDRPHFIINNEFYYKR